jgi:hypothetical protein
MAVHACLPGGGVALFGLVQVAVGPERPRPAGGHHHGLEVVGSGVALANRQTVGPVLINLPATDRAPGYEGFEGLPGERRRVPLTVVAGLRLVGRGNAHQAHGLRAEPHGLAIHDLEARLRTRHDGIVVGLRARRNGQDEGQEAKSPHGADSAIQLRKRRWFRCARACSAARKSMSRFDRCRCRMTFPPCALQRGEVPHTR